MNSDMMMTMKMTNKGYFLKLVPKIKKNLDFGKQNNKQLYLTERILKMKKAKAIGTVAVIAAVSGAVIYFISRNNKKKDKPFDHTKETYDEEDDDFFSDDSDDERFALTDEELENA